MKDLIVFIVLEVHISESFKILKKELLNKNYKIEVFRNKTISRASLYWRCRNGNDYLSRLRSAYISWLEERKIINPKLIIFSSGEGFEIVNINYWFLGELQKSKKIAIQHGIFGKEELSSTRRKSMLMVRSSINLLSSIVLGFNLIGYGFGSIKFDKYIVYSKYYSDYLVNYKSWRKENVLIAGRLFKPLRMIPLTKNKSSALFLLQDLVLANILSKKRFEFYLVNIIRSLCAVYQNVNLRLHPKMNVDEYMFLSDLELNCNVSLHNNLTEDIDNCTVAFSFNSTALIDAFLSQKPVVGIVIPELNLEDYQFINFNIRWDRISVHTCSSISLNNAGINKDYYDLSQSVASIMFNLESWMNENITCK